MIFSFFFFQAEDGIRDYKVTGVQTCALPISVGLVREDEVGDRRHDHWIDDAGDDRQHGQRDEGGAYMGHVGLLYTRPSATRIMSTSLIPGNGMMMPPT